jgi:hypothetical protein
VSAAAVTFGVRFAGALLALAVVGCGSPSGPLRLDYQGDDAGREAAELAATEWRETCGADVRLDPTGIPLAETEEGVPAGSGGATHEVGERAVWIHFRPGGDVRAKVAHEIGHALGLPHTAPGVADLMATEDTGVRHVTEADCSALARLR